jgi:hypothetical protein
MEELYLDILFDGFNTKLVSYILISGFLIFTLYYSGSPKWDKFTDFDKISFSVLTGVLLFYFVIVPISWLYIYYTDFFMHNYHSFTYTSEEVIEIYKNISLMLVTIVFIVKYVSKNSLYENNDFHEYSVKGVYLIFFIICILFAITTISLAISDYSQYSITFFGLFILIAIVFFFFIVIYTSTHNNLKFYLLDDGLRLAENLEDKKKSVLMTLLLLTIVSAVFGLIFFNVSISEKGETLNEIQINSLNFSEDSSMGGYEVLTKVYDIKMPYLIPWTRISFDHRINAAYTTYDNSLYTVKHPFTNNRNLHYIYVNKTSRRLNLNVVYEDSFGFERDDLIKATLEQNNSTKFINVSYTNNMGSNVIIDSVFIPINSSFYLRNEDFLKSKFIEGTGTDLGIYLTNTSNEYVVLEGVALQNDSFGFTKLILTKK